MSPEKENAVEIRKLNIAYDHKMVIENLDLNIKKGELTAIIGPNGAGKSTLIKGVLNLVKPISGKIEFNLENKGKGQISYVPQSGSVDWDFPTTVKDVVLMGRYGAVGWVRRPKKKDKQMVIDVLEKVGMKEYATTQISQLSGGQQQRVFLARSLVQNAEILFLDEPLKGVDAKTEDIIISHLKELKRQGKTIIVVHHNLQTVKNYFDYVVLLNIQLVAQGRVSEVFNELNLQKTYETSNEFFRKVEI